MLPCVSQGAAPLGPRGDDHRRRGQRDPRAGRAAGRSRRSSEVIGELDLHERALIAGGLLLGIVIDGGKPEYEQGDFLVRGVLGADPAPARSRSARACARARWCACTPVTPARPTRICAARCACALEAIGGAAAGRSAGLLLQRARAAMFGACDHDADAGRRRARRRPGRRFLRRRGDRPGGRAQLPAHLHGHGGRVPGADAPCCARSL